MAVTSTTPRNDFVGEAATDTYDFDFQVLSAADLAIYEDGVLQSVSADYTVTLNDDRTGSVTRVAGNLPDGSLLAIVSAPTAEQPVQLTRAKGYRPDIVERALDRLAIQLQAVDEQVRHAIRLPLSENIDALLAGSAAARATKLVGFDADGALALAAPAAGGGGGGSGSGIGRSVTEDGAIGNGLSDDKAAIEATIAAVNALGGGVVYFPRGTYFVSGTTKVSVPFGVRLMGESMDSTIIRGPGFEAFGDNVSFEDIEFRDPSVDGTAPAVLPCTLKTIDHSHFAVRRCRLNRAWIDVRNTMESTQVEDVAIIDNHFTGDFTAWIAVTGCNAITIMGASGVNISHNRMTDIVFPHRILKLQASTFAIVTIGDAHNSHVVITGNIFIGEMKSGKQCVDLYSGTRDLIFTGNVFDISQSGSGCSTVIESKTGQTATQVQAYTHRQIIRGNIFKAACGQVAGISGGYSMAWENEDQVVDFSANIIDTTGAASVYGIDFRGLHEIKCNDNVWKADAVAAGQYRAFSFGNCRDIICSNNLAACGGIYVWGGSSTSGGDPYTGETKQITCIGNILSNFRSDHGGIECIALVGTPDVTVIGNTLDSDMGLSTQALVYLRDSTFGVVLVALNNGDTTSVGRNRYLKVSATVTLEREYLNSWQTEALQVYDEATRRLVVGAALGDIGISLAAAAASEASIYYAQAGVNRLIASLLSSGLDYQLRARDTSGIAIDSPLSFILAAAGLITIGGATSRTVAFTGAIRPSVDALNDLGTGSQRWRSLVSSGAFHTGSRLITAAGSQSIADTDHFITVDCTAGNVTLSLLTGTAARQGKKLVIQRIDNSGNTLTLNRGAAPDVIHESFTAVTTTTILAGERMELCYEYTITSYIAKRTA